MKLSIVELGSMTCLLALVGSCSGDATSLYAIEAEPAASETLGQTTGELRSKVRWAHTGSDVAAIEVKVIPVNVANNQAVTCAGQPVATELVMLEERPYPTGVVPAGTGDEHDIGDVLFVLAANEYLVCAQPLNKLGKRSTDCLPVHTRARISDGLSTDVLLTSQCGEEARGTASVIVGLNESPVVDEIRVDQTRLLAPCDEVILTVKAHDPDRDRLSYAWSVEPNAAALRTDGAKATFSASTAGKYQVTVTVADTLGGSTTQTFPIYVTGPDCRT
jgi:hypothetical protein